MSMWVSVEIPTFPRKNVCCVRVSIRVILMSGTQHRIAGKGKDGGGYPRLVFMVIFREREPHVSLLSRRRISVDLMHDSIMPEYIFSRI